MSAEDNKRSVRAVVRGGVEQAELARQRIRIADPPIGGARDGIQPGQWGEPPDMPPDCPVRVLGLVGEAAFIDAVFFMLVNDSLNQKTYLRLSSPPRFAIDLPQGREKVGFEIWFEIMNQGLSAK